MPNITSIDPRSEAARALMAELDAYQMSLYPAESNHLDSIEMLVQPHVHFLGVIEGDQLWGCGAVKLMESEYGEIKRMYVIPKARGRGIGRQILLKLESTVQKAGLPIVRLETGIRQPEAIRMYRRCGYYEVPPFGDYQLDPLSIFMEKRLDASEPRLVTGCD